MPAHFSNYIITDIVVGDWPDLQTYKQSDALLILTQSMSSRDTKVLFYTESDIKDKSGELMILIDSLYSPKLASLEVDSEGRILKVRESKKVCNNWPSDLTSGLPEVSLAMEHGHLQLENNYVVTAIFDMYNSPVKRYYSICHPVKNKWLISKEAVISVTDMLEKPVAFHSFWIPGSLDVARDFIDIIHLYRTEQSDGFNKLTHLKQY